ncbi:hypothetical protein [Candidatus Formimonas warabiya]|uniref:Uncharacterized protein n=1 Tax=Formimonas warabiya TaxID=1761012 RepID=A0A3G1L0R2_FORW1|nr:hypothetical protein [Candidatus Formimonas warabiya]ATW28257.1 hypothetical protein DCMF_28985 [Candidatus Formimonas warabiya]
MGSIPKVKSLGELKSLINNHKGTLSEGNLKIINQIIGELEKGGVSKSNKENLKSLMNKLASKNGVQVPKK